MHEMGRAFKAPKQDDIEQWAKAEALIKNGFTFHSYGWGGRGKYPSRLRDVDGFLEKSKTRNQGQRLLSKIKKK